MVVGDKPAASSPAPHSALLFRIVEFPSQCLSFDAVVEMERAISRFLQHGN
jgi:hypothetical protein